MAKHKCVGKIWGDYRDVSGRIYSCSRNATTERDGKWWCWQHDPERVEADKKKRRAAEDAKQARRSGMYARRARNARLGALVTEETAALLDKLASHIPWQIRDDIATQGHDLASRIREALEVNDEG